MSGHMRHYYKGENDVGGVKSGDKPVGWTPGWYQPEACEDSLVAFRRDASARVEYWAGEQKRAASAKDFDLARFCSAELKTAQKEVRVLNELRDRLCPPAPFAGHLPKKVWPLDAMPELGFLSARIRLPLNGVSP